MSSMTSNHLSIEATSRKMILSRLNPKRYFATKCLALLVLLALIDLTGGKFVKSLIQSNVEFLSIPVPELLPVKPWFA